MRRLPGTLYSHNFEFLRGLLVFENSQLSRFFFPQLFRILSNGSNVTFVNLWKLKNLFCNIFIKSLRIESNFELIYRVALFPIEYNNCHF